MQEGLLDGQLALITGSSTGIGAAIAVAFARQGAKLVITAEPEQQENLDKASVALVVPALLRANDQLCVMPDLTDSGERGSGWTGLLVLARRLCMQTGQAMLR